MKNQVFSSVAVVLESKVFRDTHMEKTDSTQKPGNVTGNVTIGNVRAGL